MRLYVHTKTHTWIFKGTGEETVQFVLSEFVRTASSHTGLKDASVLRGVLPNGKQLAGTDPIKKYFADRDDLHVVVASSSAPQPARKATAEAASKPANAPASGSANAATTHFEDSLQLVTDLLSKASIAVTNKHYAQARSCKPCARRSRFRAHM